MQTVNRFTLKLARGCAEREPTNGMQGAPHQNVFRLRRVALASTRKTRVVQTTIMAAKAQHDYAVYLFQQGCYEDALTHLDEILREQESGELWSDWATAQFALSHFSEAEHGFRRALQMSPELTDASVTFATMLVSLSRWKEAIALFDDVLPKLDPEARAAVSPLAAQCRGQVG